VIAHQEPTRQDGIYFLFAFLGRYGHQDWNTLGCRTVQELNRFAEAINKLLKDEGDSSQSRMETDGV